MHIPSFLRVALAACALAAVAATPAMAAPVQAQLRVEGPNGQIMDPGFWYLNDTATLAAATSCGGSGAEKTLTGPTALGIVDYGARYNQKITPVEVSDQFDFGLFVCSIGGVAPQGEAFWGFRVNHVVAEVGADQYQLKPGDRVLWTYTDFSAGINSGNELVLQTTDDWVKAGESAEVRILEYDFAGNGSPAAGVQVGGQVTDAAGEATIPLPDAGRFVLRGIRGSDIPTAPKRICVWENAPTECETLSHGRIVGTTGADQLKGGSVPEFLVGRRGNDRFNVRDSATDVVSCGPGDDVVIADKFDRARRDCEQVKRK
jgi:hypothetical protein